MKSLIFCLTVCLLHSSTVSEFFSASITRKNIKNDDYLVMPEEDTTDKINTNNMCKNSRYSCPSKTPIEFDEDRHHNFVRSVPAIGFQYDTGAAWAIICTDSRYGMIPGKLDNKHDAYFSFDGHEIACKDWVPIHGELVYYQSPLPQNCTTKGYQDRNGEKYYSAVIMSENGMIPGKANENLSMAWYSFDMKEFSVRKNFYVIC